MNKLWRVIDAEYNRVTEGLRVLEDLARFYWENERETTALKQLRSHLAALLREHRPELLANRDSDGDLGVEVSQTLQLDRRSGISDLVDANFKRVEEGLRSLEEHLKVLELYPTAKTMERYRFHVYSLEKNAAVIQTKALQLQHLKSGLYGITALEFSQGRSNLEVVSELLKAGIKVIQYREKERKLGEQYRECLAIRQLTREYQACFIVNDHLDLALAVEADGIHLGQDDLPVEAARKLVGERMIIGLSTHSSQQADAAVKAGADYIGVGPIFKTFTKKDVCAPVNLSYLDYVVAHHSILHVAIGGIKESNVTEVVRHGAHCIAMVTELVGAADIGAKVKAVMTAIESVKESIE